MDSNVLQLLKQLSKALQEVVSRHNSVVLPHLTKHQEELQALRKEVSLLHQAREMETLVLVRALVEGSLNCDPEDEDSVLEAFGRYNELRDRYLATIALADFLSKPEDG